MAKKRKIRARVRPTQLRKWVLGLPLRAAAQIPGPGLKVQRRQDGATARRVGPTR